MKNKLINLNLRHFSKSEFREWWDLMDIELLIKLDTLRWVWKNPIVISPNPDSLGRNGTSPSTHNYKYHGTVKAADVFPKANGKYLDNGHTAQEFFILAKAVGFTGIGAYGDTKPGIMFHLDVRSNRPCSIPSVWGRLQGEYCSINKVF